ncbi:MAG: dihydroxyacetone kinase subunit L [Clostridiales bacterium]|nr:dihydroxyacetone kinase subunit L [Clostridiales bacterium]
MTDSRKVMEIIEKISYRIEEEKDYLTMLDQPIGDSDHGINLARGFGAVREKLPTLAGKDIGTILKTTGMTLVSTVGGASGPLYGSAYMKAGMAMAGKQEMSLQDFLAMMKVFVEAVQQRGKAVAEEATMLDAMIPSLAAMEEAAAQGETPGAVLDAGVKAAWAGVEHTKDLVATKGRASYVGERGLGHPDPGATSYSYMLEVVRDSCA